MSNRTHRALWAVWAGMCAFSFAALEFIPIENGDEPEPTQDYFSWLVRDLLNHYPPLWFGLAGSLSWLSYHFLSPTVPWTRHGSY